jgi:Cdc6-like AAA superfamily ATPase
LKTREKIEEAMDGVLFIDEAYSLARGGPGDFGQEAIDTLTPAMARLQGRLVVVAAGYPAPMEEFLARNKSLRSRFTERLWFPDYSAPELAEILVAMARAEPPAYRFTPAARDKAEVVLGRRKAARSNDFGNGREARTLLVEIERRLAGRTIDLPADTDRSVLTTFEAEDVPDA